MKKLVNKRTTQMLALGLSIALSNMVLAVNPPELNGPYYSDGPISPLFANTDLSIAEKAAYSLFEGVMQIAISKIHASSCNSSIGTSTIEIFSDGSQNNSPFNFIDLVSNGGALTLDADISAPDNFRGQKIAVNQDGPGIFSGTPANHYRGKFSFNQNNNILWGYGRMDVAGINGFLDRYHSKVIRNFIRSSINSSDFDYYIINDWGLQTLEKLGYPVNKYWQRSRSRRSNGSIGRTVLVKDRLVGATACRITITTEGSNNQDYFWQEGTLKIELIEPSEVVYFD